MMFAYWHIPAVVNATPFPQRKDNLANKDILTKPKVFYHQAFSTKKHQVALPENHPNAD